MVEERLKEMEDFLKKLREETFDGKYIWDSPYPPLSYTIINIVPLKCCKVYIYT